METIIAAPGVCLREIMPCWPEEAALQKAMPPASGLFRARRGADPAFSDSLWGGRQAEPAHLLS
jgi:hypothetical protein